MPEAPAFIIIGENIHTTRVLLRSGRNVEAQGDDEWLSFVDVHGAARRVPIPEWYRETDEFSAGRLKHVAIAVRTAMEGGSTSDDALAYLRTLSQRQERAGAAYLDVNVDELSPKLAEQKAAIQWLVRQIQGWTDLPLAIDSSHPEIIAAGLDAVQGGQRPMTNSASLERRSTLDLALAAGGPVIVTAAGSAGMPQDVEGRITNASEMVDGALKVGFTIGDIYVDPLIFPISVDAAFGGHALEAIRRLRERYGPQIHITGGMSNVSFGMPGRKLINDVFLRLALDAGADSGIVDPVATDLVNVRTLDVGSGAHALAQDAILGRDINCRAYLRAYRGGAFAEHGIVPPVRSVA